MELLTAVMARTAEIIEGIDDGQWGLPTPCEGLTVGDLVDHVLGWVQVFAAASTGAPHHGDPDEHERGAEPAEEFRATAARLVAGWNELGFDRKVTMTGGEVPASMAFTMTLMEYMGHGWDLAVATDQPLPFTDAQAAAFLPRAEMTLLPDYRGPGTPFGVVVAVPDTAPAVDRLVGFLGRTPR